MSRPSRSPGLRPRPARTLPASIVAVLLLALGVMMVLAVVFRLITGGWTGPSRSVLAAISSITWAAVPFVGAGLIVLGLVLLVAAIIPGRRSAVSLCAPTGGGPADEFEAVISRSAIARLAAGHADMVDGVSKVSATATDRRVRLSVVTPTVATAEIRERVLTAVRDGLQRAGLQPMPTITAAVRTRDL